MKKQDIVVIDSIMGSGKTTWAINHMKQNPDTNFIYITPYISETNRIIEQAAPERNFRAPHRTSATEGKLDNFVDLITYGHDVVSTHELFKRFDDNTKTELLFSSTSYTLIIDETLDVITPVQANKTDIKLCLNKELITIDENGLCKWNYKEDDNYNGVLHGIEQIVKTNCVICIHEKFFIWRLDPDIFKSNYFDKIIILTYLFDGSIMKTYFDYYEIEYKKMSIKDSLLVPYYEPDITEIAKLINLYDGSLNTSFDQTNQSLSATWYRDKVNEKNINQLRRNMDNYFRHVMKSPQAKILWSTFHAADSSEKHVTTMLDPNRFNKQFLSCNVRGTNEYRHTDCLAYMINVFINPGVQQFFLKKDLHVNVNLYALQYMLQWIWRSAIRDNKPINIYIPSKRMRELLIKWMSNKQIPDRA